MDDRRYYALDALRGGLMMLGIVLHSAVLYLAAPPVAAPIPTDPNNAYVFDLIFYFIHSFRMPTFFVLAGFFTALLVERRGLWGTYKNRAARVLAPMLAGIVTVLPLAGLFMIDFMLSARFGVHAVLPDVTLLRQLVESIQSAGFPVDQPTLGHLWFLYYLCFFYLLIPACQFLVRRSLRIEPRLDTRPGVAVGSRVLRAVHGRHTLAVSWRSAARRIRLHQAACTVVDLLRLVLRARLLLLLLQAGPAESRALRALERRARARSVPRVVVRDAPRAFGGRARVRRSPCRGDRARTVHVDAHRPVDRRRAAFLRLRVTVDSLHLPIVVLGFPGAPAGRLRCRLVDGAIRPSCHRQVLMCHRLYDGRVFCHLSLLGAKDLGQRFPERPTVRSGLALAGGSASPATDRTAIVAPSL